MDAQKRLWGDTFYIDVIGWGRIILTCNQTLVERCFRTDMSVLSGAEANSILTPVVGQHSVFVKDGEAHLRKRRVIANVLKPREINATLSETLDKVFREHDGIEAAFSRPSQWISDTTMQIMVSLIFGVNDRDISSEIRRLLAPLIGPLSGVLAFSPGLQEFGGAISIRRIFERRFERFSRAVKTLLKPSRTGSWHKSIAARLAQSDYTPDEIFDEVVTLLVAGSDTTATAILWAMFHVFSDEACFAKAKEEVEVTNETDEPGLNTKQMYPYLKALIFESLRLVPTVDFYPRQIVDAERRTFVAPCSYLIHRDERLYDSPTEFQPDRFLNTKFGPYAFLPFGGGQRRCPGANLSIDMSLLILAAMIRRSDGPYRPNKSLKAIRRNVLLAPANFKLRASG